LSTREHVIGQNGGSRGELQAIGDYVNDHVLRLRDAMWLGEWTITVIVNDRPGGDPSNLAHVDPIQGQYRATIEVSTQAAEDPDELHRTLIHELLHLAHRNQTEVIRLSLIKPLGAGEYDIMWEAFRQQTELMVENLCTMLVPLLPMPDSRN
jgi:hypothetical protein